MYTYRKDKKCGKQGAEYKLCICIILLVYMILFFRMSSAFLQNSDTLFLINRAKQMLHCIQNGNIPFFYYDDYYGLGYGSAFFYGHLTLYPFLPILAIFGEKFFIITWFSTALVLYSFGVVHLTKAITSNYRFVSVMYLAGSFTTFVIFEVAMLCNMMGTAIAFWCLYFSIRYFKDNQSYVPAALLFFLVLNTHLISAVLCFFGIVLICIYYWDKTRMKSYCKFALITCSLCSYFIVNFMYHSGSIGNVSAINRMIQNSSQVTDVYSMAKFPFGSFCQLIIFKKFTGITFCDFITLIVLFVLCAKHWKNLTYKKKVLLLLCVLSIILGSGCIWKLINSKIILIPIQFSYRYLSFVWLLLLCILFGQVKSHELKMYLSIWVLLYATLTCCLFGASDKHSVGQSQYIGNGEYLPKDYRESMIRKSVLGPDSRLVSCITDDRMLSFQAKQAGEYQIPKVWYRGYKATIKENGIIKEIKCYEKDGFVTLNLPNASASVINVYYEHPTVLIFLDFLCLLLCVSILIKYIKNRKRCLLCK